MKIAWQTHEILVKEKVTTASKARFEKMQHLGINWRLDTMTTGGKGEKGERDGTKERRV